MEKTHDANSYEEAWNLVATLPLGALIRIITDFSLWTVKMTQEGTRWLSPQ